VSAESHLSIKTMRLKYYFCHYHIPVSQLFGIPLKIVMNEEFLALERKI
jgi:hypothetical protein